MENKVQYKLVSFDVETTKGRNFIVQVYEADNGAVTTMKTPVESIAKELELRKANIYTDLSNIGQQRKILDEQETELNTQLQRIAELKKQHDKKKSK